MSSFIIINIIIIIIIITIIIKLCFISVIAYMYTVFINLYLGRVYWVQVCIKFLTYRAFNS